MQIILNDCKFQHNLWELMTEISEFSPYSFDSNEDQLMTRLSAFKKKFNDWSDGKLDDHCLMSSMDSFILIGILCH